MARGDFSSQNLGCTLSGIGNGEMDEALSGFGAGVSLASGWGGGMRVPDDEGMGWNPLRAMTGGLLFKGKKKKSTSAAMKAATAKMLAGKKGKSNLRVSARPLGYAMDFDTGLTDWHMSEPGTSMDSDVPEGLSSQMRRHKQAQIQKGRNSSQAGTSRRTQVQSLPSSAPAAQGVVVTTQPAVAPEVVSRGEPLTVQQTAPAKARVINFSAHPMQIYVPAGLGEIPSGLSGFEGLFDTIKKAIGVGVTKAKEQAKASVTTAAAKGLAATTANVLASKGVQQALATTGQNAAVDAVAAKINQGVEATKAAATQAGTWLAANKTLVLAGGLGAAGLLAFVMMRRRRA